MRTKGRIWLPLSVVVLLVAAACGGGDDAGGTAAEDGGNGGADGPLAGLFRIEPGECSDAGVTAGSSFRMIQSGATLDDPTYVSNGDSPCGDQTWTPIEPGEAGGLLTGEYQPHPDPAFDDAGNGTASAITQPTTWFAVAFSNATNETDPQTEAGTTPPEITASGGELTGDLSAWSAAWNGTHFNQGSPKPDGSMPGNTTEVSGTYDADSGSFTLEWTSQIVGGPFDNFTGVWHLEGTFEAA